VSDEVAVRTPFQFYADAMDAVLKALDG